MLAEFGVFFPVTVSFLPAPTKSRSSFQSPFQSLFPPPSTSAVLCPDSCSLCCSRKAPSLRKLSDCGVSACASLYSSIELCTDCWLVPEYNCFMYFIQLLMAGIQSPLSHSFSSVQFSHSVVSDSLRPHELQHARPPCPSPTPGVHSDSRPSSSLCRIRTHVCSDDTQHQQRNANQSQN